MLLAQDNDYVLLSTAALHHVSLSQPSASMRCWYRFIV